MLNIAVFGSGRGSNFKSLLDALRSGRLRDVRSVLVVSNNADAGIFDHARRQGIPVLHWSRKMYASDEAYCAAMLAALREARADLIVLAGYMKFLPAPIIAAYRHRILNIHPALLPSFGGTGMYGLHVHRAVLAAHEPLTGATVHVVDEEYDHGPIVIQRTVPVLASDSPESLAARVLEMEHYILPEAIRLFAEGRITVEPDRTHVHIRSSQE
jgi:phosphoribosylglycinamide formyltransferase-1